MAGMEIIHIAIAPVDNLDNALISRVAVILGKDLYCTRLMLAGKMPKIIAHYDTEEQAEAIARSFRELNLKALVFSDSELRRYSESYRAYTAEFLPQEIAFSDRGNQSITLKSQNAFLALKGIVSVSRETEIITQKTKLDVPLTVMTGGIPIVRQVKEAKSNVTSREEYFVRIYDRDTVERHIEILQNDFDYSCLGEQMGLSSISNFNLLLTRIAAAFPDMTFDDRLLKYSSPVAISHTLNNIEVNCRLIHAFSVV